MRVVAVNSIGKSKPSVALSLRTEEEGELLYAHRKFVLCGQV